jgi:hypothetical protein
MGYSDAIAREAETLPPEKLKVRQLPSAFALTPKNAEEIAAFFRSFKADISGYKFDRDDTRIYAISGLETSV